jgi:dipeptidyl aminopeptidase/acylaminoacyl peptidase
MRRRPVPCSRQCRLWPMLLALLLTLSSAAASARSSDAVADFARLPEYETAKISPDGRHLAVVMRREGRRMLVMLALDTLELVGHVNFSPPNEVLNFYWADDERLLVSLAITLGALDVPLGTGELYGVNVDGTQARMLFGARAGADERPGRSARTESYAGGHRLMSLLPQDPRNVLITRVRHRPNQPPATDVALLDIHHGRMRPVARSPVPGARFVADQTGSVRFAVGRGRGHDLEVYHRGGRSERWDLITRLPLTGGTLNPIAFAADHRHVYVADSRGEDGRPDTFAVRLLDVDTGEMTDVFHDPAVDVDQLMMSPYGDLVYGLRYIPDRPRYRTFPDAQPYASILERAVEAFPGAFIDVTSIARDGSLAVLRVESDRDPGTHYLVDVSANTITKMLESRPWLTGQSLAEMQPIRFDARDRTVLHGYLTLPADAAGAGPLIVMPHGGPHFVRDEGRFDDTVQLLAHHGYAVLQVNFRGSGGYGRAFQQAGYGEWGGLVLDDIEDGVRWAVRTGHADPERICAVGFSFGAYAALMGSARYPERYRCVAGIAGVYDLPLLLDAAYPPAGRAMLRAAVGADRADLQAVSPVHQAARISADVLIIHGVEDARAPVEHARRMRAALDGSPTRDGEDAVDYLEIPREGHGFYRPENRIESYERLLAFLHRHLAAEPHAAAGRHFYPAP